MDGTRAYRGNAGRNEDAREVRRTAVQELRTDAMPIRKIAETIGVSKSCVQDDLVVLRQRWRERYTDSFEQHVARHVGETGAVIDAVWQSKQLRESPSGLQVLLNALAREASLLGLDKPQKTENVSGILNMTLDERRDRLHQLVDRFLGQGEAGQDALPESGVSHGTEEEAEGVS